MLENVKFLAAADALADLPRETRAEVAFVGRSNSGKSSAINALTGRKRIARVSRTPGRTRQINLFSVGAGAVLVDLPGYGYARVPDRMKDLWAGMISDYLLLRRQLVGVVLVMDSRHPLTPLDRRLLDWIRPVGKPLLILLTKADKLGSSESRQVLALTRADLRKTGTDASVQLFSSVTREGTEQAAETVSHWLGVSRAGASRIKNPRFKGTKPGAKPQLD
jgi:GTP-binding protein